MATPEQFAKNIRKIVATVEGNTEKALREAALAIDAQVVVATPRDTGRAAANWLVGLDGPVTKETDDFPKGKMGSTGNAVNAQAISQAKEEVGKHKEGQAIFISNNVEYLGDLNRGSSAQASAMFIERGIVAGVQAVKGVKLLKPTK